jgi:2-dehydropantoate 2-reductase
MKKPIKIAVVGAGSVGCYFGGMLARAGQDVSLIARPQHVQAINQNGLLMDCVNFQDIVKLKAASDYKPLLDADLVMLCVKSYDTEKVVKEIKPFLAPEAIILSLQNGVDNVNLAQMNLDNQVYPTVVYVAVGMAGPGHLKHFGRGELVLGSMTDLNEKSGSVLESIAQFLTANGVPSVVSKEIKKELWLKFLVNCIYNGISAVGQIEYGQMVRVPAINVLIETLTREFLEVAAKEGVNISWDEAIQANRKIAETMAHQKSSTAQDLSKKKLTEIEFLNGFIVRKGFEHQVSTPSHQALYAMVKMFEFINTQV